MSEIGATPRIFMGGWSVVSFRAKEMQSHLLWAVRSREKLRFVTDC